MKYKSIYKATFISLAYLHCIRIIGNGGIMEMNDSYSNDVPAPAA